MSKQDLVEDAYSRVAFELSLAAFRWQRAHFLVGVPVETVSLPIAFSGLVQALPRLTLQSQDYALGVVRHLED